MRWTLWFMASLLACEALGADNVLTREEQEARWILLFDGKTFRGWRDPTRMKPPGDAWYIEDGCLTTRPGARISEDLITEESYTNFELSFEWKLAPGANSGVKYRIQKTIFIDNSKAQKGAGGFEGLVGREFLNPVSERKELAEGSTAQEYTVAFEMQLIDDERHPDARRGADRRSGALYGMVPPEAFPSKPAGEWNTGRIVVRGEEVEHWINGVRVLKASLKSEQVRSGIQQRWKAAPEVGQLLLNASPSGPISLQYHGDKVWFRNLKLRRLPK